MKNFNVILNDIDTKKDITSILVRARKTDLDGGYAMGDRAMMDQMASP